MAFFNHQQHHFPLTPAERASSDDEDGDTEKLLAESHGHYSETARGSHTREIILLVALILSIGTNIYFALLPGSIDLDRLCIRHTSLSNPPILKDVDLRYIDVEFNGTFAKQTAFRQKAGPEADAAWESLGINYKPVLIPEGEAAERAGLKKGLLKRAREDGGGYLVNVEGMHHLHCLNLLRKTSHWNYPYYKELGLSEFKNDDDILFEHYGHCLDIIRQQLMCTVDFNVFGQVWVEKTQTAFPDFMTTHRCKNFETVRQWAYENQIEANPKDMAMPLREGDIILPEAP